MRKIGKLLLLVAVFMAGCGIRDAGMPVNPIIESHSIDLDQLDTEVLGDALYDSGIGEVGTLKSYHESIYSEIVPDKLLYKEDLMWLQVDPHFPGAAKINEYLTGCQNFGTIDEEELEWLEQGVASEGDEWRIYYSYSSEVPGISYYDGQYLSFIEFGYSYAGGAHGTPGQTGYTFNLQTGDRLKLSDVVKNSEEELKEIAVKYFGELIEADPLRFWQDALDTVRKDTGYDSEFYLTEEGIRLYFGVYALAGPSDGILEVTIPYGEFDMKIILGQK